MKSPRVSLVYGFFLKAAGVLTAVAVAIATLGIPLPVPLVKDIAQAFPCMNCACGCVNADMCWRECCCYTSSQKLAWAAKHGVRVPGFVLQQVATEANAEANINAVYLAEVNPCCRQRVLASKVRSCCDRKSGSSGEPAQAATPLVPGVLAIHALKCHGLSLTVSLLPPSVPADEISRELPLLPGEQVAIFSGPLYQPPFFDAVVPPPEVAT